MVTFQELIRRLSLFWEKQGCLTQQGYDLEVGAGTFNPATFLRCLGPEPYKTAYVEPCRRPTDGRYGMNPNRLQHYFQYQVIMKPSPANILDLYLQSLEAIGFNLQEHDIRFVHDDWESPTLGASGLGWEVWMDGMEVTQFTYFQNVAGQSLNPITAEITYGTERLAMYLQGVNNFFEIHWNEQFTYGELYQRNEVEWSHYNFENASTDMWKRHFEDYEKEAKLLIEANLPIPAYDFVMKCSHAFNLLDARGVISVTERTGYIGRIRQLARLIAEEYLTSRKNQGYPLLKSQEIVQSIPNVVPIPTPTNDKEDFIVEIGSEELPATFVPIGRQQLEKAIKKLLEEEKIVYENLESYGTPRRLAVFVKGLSIQTKGEIIEKKGPPLSQLFDENSQITATGEGFFRSLNSPAPSLKQIQTGEISQFFIKTIKEVPYLFAKIETAAKRTAEILAKAFPEIILGLEFPKKMRWSPSDIAYARPIQWILCLLGKDLIPFSVGEISTNRFTVGHRQLTGSLQVKLEKAVDYLAALREQHVIAHVEERKKKIEEQLNQIEQKHVGLILSREEVISQVLYLVEQPYLTVAPFDERFLQLPKEVIVSEMVEHQKYFPLADHEGKLKNLFVITANIPPTDSIRAGNQRVLSARLSDGSFLYDQDLKISLEQLNEKLKTVTFQKDLGTIFNKVERLIAHSKFLQKALQMGDPLLVERAARLSKADLASAMVYEFPHLQGTIGKYYALAQRENREVALALEEQWMPIRENGVLPETTTGIILSLADKIDNLIGCFGVDLKPSSSGDPYGLRKQTFGLIKIIIQGGFRLPIRRTLATCLEHFPTSLFPNKKELIKEIETFISQRLKSIMLDYQFEKDAIEAALTGGFEDIDEAFSKVKALHRFRESPEFPLLWEAYKRAKGQLNGHLSRHFDPLLLKEPAEKALDQKLVEMGPRMDEALVNKNYDQAYLLLAELQPPLSLLFEKVKILDEDVRICENRLALLQRVFSYFQNLLDFSKIQQG